MKHNRMTGILAVTLILAGCPAISPGGPQVLGNDTKTGASVPAGALKGVILGPDGKPAVGATVHAYPVDAAASAYRIQGADTTATTDASGSFVLASPPEGKLNIEAVKSDTLKVFKGQVNAQAAAATDLGNMTLQPTGTITGKVTAPNAPSVTNFEGVDVFIPGSSYVAKATTAGTFTISNVAVGSFSLVATKTGLGRGAVANVSVESDKAASAPDLAMSVTQPAITSISPLNGAPGATVSIKGSNFGASTGDTFQVAFAGASPINPRRIDDNTIQAVVPVGATNGAVQVTVGGIASDGKDFTVLKSISIGPDLWDRVMLLNSSKQLSIRVTDTSDHVVANPCLEWKVTGSAATVDASGSATATSAGRVTFTASSGNLYLASNLHVLPAYANVSTAQSNLHSPNSFFFDASGNMYFQQDIRQLDMITPQGVRSIAISADAATQSVLMAMDTNGDIFSCEMPRNDGSYPNPGVAAIVKYTQSGTVKTTVGALNSSVRPVGLLAYNGTIFISDNAASQVLKMTADGTVVSLAGGTRGFADGTGSAAKFGSLGGLVRESNGNLLVADPDNNAVRRVTPQGVVTTAVANAYHDPVMTSSSGPTTGSASTSNPNFIPNAPFGITLDASGNIYVSDGSIIRKIDANGVATPLAGNTYGGFADGLANVALFNTLRGLAVDSNGALFAADSGNGRIRKIQ